MIRKSMIKVEGIILKNKLWILRIIITLNMIILKNKMFIGINHKISQLDQITLITLFHLFKNRWELNLTNLTLTQVENQEQAIKVEI